MSERHHIHTLTTALAAATVAGETAIDALEQGIEQGGPRALGGGGD